MQQCAIPIIIFVFSNSSSQLCLSARGVILPAHVTLTNTHYVPFGYINLDTLVTSPTDYATSLSAI
jgi:hypothetical protein